jgi:hypothetical protein
MLTRKRLPRLVLLACGLLAAGWVARIALAPTPHRINRENYGLIQNGITQAEVEAMLGRPSGEYQSPDTMVVGPFRVDWREGRRESWSTDDCVIWVWFNDEGAVREKTLGGLWPYESHGLLDRLREWFGQRNRFLFVE